MTAEIRIKKARLGDAEAIAGFINKSRTAGTKITPDEVVERFSDVGFLLTKFRGQIVGLLGWQVENLVARVTDFLIAPAIDRVIAGRALIEAMEEEAKMLQAEVAMLFLPSNPPTDLIEFWELFDYERRTIKSLNRNWRDVAREWNPQAEEVMLKTLRTGLIHRPM
jgi:dephospho-CoA kinase